MYAKTISNDRCREYSGRSWVTSNMICTVSTDNTCRQSGMADSGGPLVTAEGGNAYSYKLIGRASNQD